MKVDIITKYPMQWLKGYKEVFPNCEIFDNPYKSIPVEEDRSAMLFMWCDKEAIEFLKKDNACGSKVIVFVRRYEYYTSAIEEMDWSKVDAVIMVNPYLARGFEERTGIKPHVVYNGITPDDWRYRERKHGGKIARSRFYQPEEEPTVGIADTSDHAGRYYASLRRRYSGRLLRWTISTISRSR